MNASMDETRPRGRPPLLALSVIVGTMLIIPAFLYSVAPEEPLKAGVLVFASGKQRAYLTQPARYDDLGYSGTCVLEPGDPLMITSGPGDGNGKLVARIEGRTKMEFPFCPPQAIVIVRRHQVIQKSGLWQELQNTVTHFVKPK